jgi:hypothetical protein
MITVDQTKLAKLDAEKRIAELKTLLAESDFKFSVDYDDQDTPEWNQLKADRQAWRDEVRQLEAL